MKQNLFIFLLKREAAVNVRLSEETHPCSPEMFYQTGTQGHCSPHLLTLQWEKECVSEMLGLRNPWADTADLGGKMAAAQASHEGNENLSCFLKDKQKRNYK